MTANISIVTEQAGTKTQQAEKKAQRDRKAGLTPNPIWVQKMEEETRAFRDEVLDSPMVRAMADGSATLEQMRNLVTQFYPFIHEFPKYLALNLVKSEDDYSQDFFIDNIRTEKTHAKQWRWMGLEVGIGKKELQNTEVSVELHALAQWIWSINSRGSLAEGVAATSYAVEGITGEITFRTVEGLARMKLGGRGWSKRGLSWWRTHAHYDDIHPYVALEVIKRYAKTEEQQRAVQEAVKRSLQYLRRALDACYHGAQSQNESKSA